MLVYVCLPHADLFTLCSDRFVNISPADYNADETQTSLNYAARVKLITNSAAKNQDSAEVSRYYTQYMLALMRSLLPRAVPIHQVCVLSVLC